ncbi:MAG: nucleoside-diphosphate kinase, partial [Candidatus Micrarchaeota archaeon]|nr:nucleoside-diphosphate kinase [Candidatus Micrarchaeota archaeon]
ALIGKIIAKFEDTGLKVAAIKIVKPNKDVVSRHYVEDKAWMEGVGNKTIKSQEAQGIKMNETALEIGMRVRAALMDYLTGRPVVAMVIEGNEAVAMVAKITGATSPVRADPSTIRGTYASDSYDLADSKKRAVKNILHASDSKATAEREIGVWFADNEVISYKRSDEDAMY